MFRCETFGAKSLTSAGLEHTMGLVVSEHRVRQRFFQSLKGLAWLQSGKRKLVR